MKRYISLAFLRLDVMTYLPFAPVADGYRAIARIPQVSAPQPALELRMLDKQLPGNRALDYFHHGGYAELRTTIDKKMDMVRHDFHRRYLESIFGSDVHHNAFASVGNGTGQDPMATLRAPNDMVLQGINVTPTICQPLDCIIRQMLISHKILRFCTIRAKNVPPNSRLKSRECGGWFFKEKSRTHHCGRDF